MLDITITNLSDTQIDNYFVLKVAKTVLENEEKKDLSIVFSTADFIKNINFKYRNKNKVTDVLAFPENFKEFKGIINSWGEIVICPDQVRSQADKSFNEELASVLIHGILHLMGYDHETSEEEFQKMKKKEDYFLSLVIKK